MFIIFGLIYKLLLNFFFFIKLNKLSKFNYFLRLIILKLIKSFFHKIKQLLYIGGKLDNNFPKRGKT